MRRSIESPRKDQTGQDVRTCRIVVINDVLETRTEVVSPQSPMEAMENHGRIRLAKHFLSWHGTGDQQRLDGTYDSQPIGVAIHRMADQVIVRWFATGDDDAAKTLMQEVLSGVPWWLGEEGGAVL